MDWYLYQMSTILLRQIHLIRLLANYWPSVHRNLSGGKPCLQQLSKSFLKEISLASKQHATVRSTWSILLNSTVTKPRLNSLWPSDALSWSILVYVTAWCLTALCHCPNQCCLSITGDFWNSYLQFYMKVLKISLRKTTLKSIFSKLKPHFPEENELTTHTLCVGFLRYYTPQELSQYIPSDAFSQML